MNTKANEAKVQKTCRRMQQTWLVWGIGPLVAAALLMLAVSGHAWASTRGIDEHIVERGFHAVLAVCAALFLIAMWLDGRWTNSDVLAARIWIAAGGRQFRPSRSQLASQADIAFKSITTSAKMLVIIGGAIAAAAVISVGYGLPAGQYGVQLLLLGLAYQIFVFSRYAYYRDVLSAAANGELLIPEDMIAS